MITMEKLMENHDEYWERDFEAEQAFVDREPESDRKVFVYKPRKTTLETATLKRALDRIAKLMTFNVLPIEIGDYMSLCESVGIANLTPTARLMYQNHYQLEEEACSLEILWDGRQR